MAAAKIGEFLTGLAECLAEQQLNAWRIVEIIFILATLVRLYKMGKKQPDKERRVTSVSLGGFLATVAPFAFIQALSAFGLRLFDADWAKLGLTPLDILFWVSVILQSVMSGEKLFGVIDTAPPDENTRNGTMPGAGTDETAEREESEDMK